MIEINKNEVIRYLGYRGITEPDEYLNQMIDDCMEDMQKLCVPRNIYKIFPIKWSNDSCEFEGIKVGAGNLLVNLKGCSEIVMMAVTIGPQADMLVRRSEIRDMLKAYTYQSVGAAYVEAYCDEVNKKIIEEASLRHMFTRPRFSPGYGDFPLEVQKDFERILDMPRTIGVTLSDSLLMTPTKSITAVVGLSDIDMDCHRSGCEVCNMHETCEFSR